LLPTALLSEKIVTSAGTLLVFLTVIVQLLSAAQTPVPCIVVMATTPPNVAAAKVGLFRSMLNIVIVSVEVLTPLRCSREVPFTDCDEPRRRWLVDEVNLVGFVASELHWEVPRP
jgi:hypothetical protein